MVEVDGKQESSVSDLSHFFCRPQIRTTFASVLLISILILILLYFLSTSSLRIVGQYIVYAFWENGMFGATHIFMLPLVYASIIFLIFSITYLRKSVEKSFNLASKSLFLSKTESQNFVRKQLKLVLSNKANMLAFIMVLAILLFDLMPTYQVRLIWINWPVRIYFLVVYSIIVFLAARGIWLFITSSFAVFRFSKTHFQADLRRLNDWLRSDRTGGIKPLSDLSLRLIVFYVIGVAIFAPAPIIYRFYLYAVYLFAILIAGASTFLVLQFLLHKTIKREKSRLLDLAEKTYSTKTRSEYTARIEEIKDWPVDLKVVLGLFLSSMLSLVAWYLFLLIRELFFPL